MSWTTSEISRKARHGWRCQNLRRRFRSKRRLRSIVCFLMWWVAAVTTSAKSSLFVRILFHYCNAYPQVHHRRRVHHHHDLHRMRSKFQRLSSATSRTREARFSFPATSAQERLYLIESSLSRGLTSNRRPHTVIQLYQSNNHNKQYQAPDVAFASTVTSNTTTTSTSILSSAKIQNPESSLMESTIITSEHEQEPQFSLPSSSQRKQRHSVVVPSTQPTVHDHLTQTDQVVVAATALLGIGAFYSLILASGEGAWRFYLAGGVCAATSHAIPTPIDVVKTRKQVDPRLRNKHFIEATKEIIRQEGVRALLAGLGPTTFGYMLEGAVKFGVYENLKPSLTRLVATVAGSSTWMSFLDSQVLAFMLCGAVSGAAAAIALCPMEALRIRMVAEPNFAPRGWLQGGFQILKYEGVAGLWKGMTPMLYKQVPYTVMKNVSFDFLTKLLYASLRTGGYAVTSTTKFAIPFMSAMIASILSCISSQPGDMLLSLVNAHGGKRRTMDFVRDILKSDRGVRSFFVGTKTRLLHVGMIVTLQLLIYDFVKRLCGIAATGLA